MLQTFDLEKRLVAALHDGSARALNLGDRWWQIYPEVTVKQCIADLVLVHASSEPNSKPARVTYFEAAILAFILERGPANIDVIADALFSTAQAVESRASKLARLGLVELNAGGDVRPTGRHLAGDIRIIAIEAKLTRWRDAIEQAASYRSFANQSFIAMPRDVIERSPNIWTVCHEAGVGALAVAGDGTVAVVLEAPHVAPQSAEWVRLLSAFVGVAHASNALSQID